MRLRKIWLKYGCASNYSCFSLIQILKLPARSKAVRPDAIVCTGRSDYPNQVNNVLCFPFIFRGALDVGATTINEEMKRAAVYAIADLALEEQNEVVTSAYGGEGATFGADYVIPRPFDPRLIVRIAPAVAKAQWNLVWQLVQFKIGMLMLKTHSVRLQNELVYASYFQPSKIGKTTHYFSGRGRK